MMPIENPGYDPYSVLKNRDFEMYMEHCAAIARNNGAAIAFSPLTGKVNLFALDTAFNISLMFFEGAAKERDRKLLNLLIQNFLQNPSLSQGKKDVITIMALRSKEYCAISKLKKTASCNPFRTSEYAEDIKSILYGIKKRSFSAFVDDRTNKNMNHILNEKAFVCRRISISIAVYLYHLRLDSPINVNEILLWLLNHQYRWLNLPEVLFDIQKELWYDAQEDYLEFQIPEEIEILGGHTLSQIIKNITSYSPFWDYLHTDFMKLIH